MTMHVDHSVYPDVDDPPSEFVDEQAKADYLHRICSAWDFGVLPDRETFTLMAEWQDVFDRFPVTTSVAYHTFRSRYGWEPVRWPTGIAPRR